MKWIFDTVNGLGDAIVKLLIVALSAFGLWWAIKGALRDWKSNRKLAIGRLAFVVVGTVVALKGFSNIQDARDLREANADEKLRLETQGDESSWPHSAETVRFRMVDGKPVRF